MHTYLALALALALVPDRALALVLVPDRTFAGRIEWYDHHHSRFEKNIKYNSAILT